MQHIDLHKHMKLCGHVSRPSVAGEKEHISLTSEKVKWVLPPNGAAAAEPRRAVRSERSPGVKRGRGRPRHHHPDDLQVRAGPAHHIKHTSLSQMGLPALP